MFFVLIIKQEIGLIEDSNQSVEMSKLEDLTSWKIERLRFSKTKRPE